MQLALFVGCGALALGLSVLPMTQDPGRQDPAQPKVAHTGMAMGSPLAKTLADCMLSCEAGAQHCAMLAMDGKKEHVQMHTMLSDCAAVCALNTSLAGHGSALQAAQLTACAAACEVCAGECAKSAEPMMKQCGDACRACAAACRAGGAANSAPR